MSDRTLPNILVTGTPGVGKSSTASLIAEKTGLKYICVGDIVKENACHEGMDTEYDSLILDEDKLVDVLEPMVGAEGGCIIDFHSCDFFPERWFDLVIVLRARTEVLYDRLLARGYSEKKRTENIECEIMMVVLEEAKDGYDEEIVQELQSNTIEEMNSNVERVKQWAEQWKIDNCN
mmetsp:Transcript_35707/g.83032  ORF Transcript_35707/g.83032 Transcript_35707/m.83032 type:complete len:177 (-) Transcript_35707:3189-3719(-)|eukprot:CAMPEP_0113323636 /NCGR_PEP_ID=MMETSP0010_2-20120614/16455_1 /TAXON_ID=216773 ORGANISM="Corethron hystrix, Strain 308" /NCGR_SAMPLE_ID=MMETSP0010_2 /ASSEMBLY_ACC=CAM_ASM_000155 /LENGTH=176 /DNA_ID=CAMNT_0000182637 /DNA_START=334 /DNA_END=864 /DNA_ORIENTATION=- /assembly_acc=CAM_ASM_000155